MSASAQEFELLLQGKLIDFVRICTYRSTEDQGLLYEIGRSELGRIMTQDPAGLSQLNEIKDGIPCSTAAHYLLLVSGVPIKYETDDEMYLWDNFGKLAYASGLKWGGDLSGRRKDRTLVYK